MSSWSDFTASNTSKWKHDVTMSALRTHRSHVGDRDTPTVEIDTPYVLPQPAVSHQPASARVNRTPVNLIKAGWGGLKKHLGSGNMLSSASSSTAATSANPSGKPHALDSYSTHAVENSLHERDKKLSREVDLVVVDRDWSAPNDQLHDTTPDGTKPLDRISSLGHGSLASGSASIASNSPHHKEVDCTIWSKHRVLTFLRWNLYPLAQDFFSSTYQDKATEAVYAREQWAMQKSLASWSCIFMIVNWILGCAFIPQPVTQADAIFYYGVATVLTFPLIIMVALNFPLTRPNFYQVFVCISVWSWSFYQIAFMFSCDFYRAPHSSCGTKDFYATFYYTSALQTVALFGLQMKRISALIGATAFFILSSILILPLMSSWTRNSINFMFYQGFLIYMHYQREKAARRMYTLRDELENQFNATQNAQINERNAAESKRRLTSYVFHDEYPDC
jgi:osomolarity two-component system sensor histidine kinase SLN1